MKLCEFFEWSLPIINPINIPEYDAYLVYPIWKFINRIKMVGGIDSDNRKVCNEIS